MITEDELMSKLRQQGVEFLAEVKFAYMEADGEISIITSDTKTLYAAKQKQDLRKRMKKRTAKDA